MWSPAFSEGEDDPGIAPWLLGGGQGLLQLSPDAPPTRPARFWLTGMVNAERERGVGLVGGVRGGSEDYEELDGEMKRYRAQAATLSGELFQHRESLQDAEERLGEAMLELERERGRNETLTMELVEARGVGGGLASPLGDGITAQGLDTVSIE